MKLIVAGSRTCNQIELVFESIEKFNSKYPITTIISGGAMGADYFGESYAKRNNLPLILFPADWKQYGKAAGMIRNRQMAEAGDALLAFWDYKSPGTKNMIFTMQMLKKPTTIIRIES